MKDVTDLNKLLLNSDTPFELSHYQVQPYSIKLKTPWHSNTLSIKYRQGFLLKLFTHQGINAIGDCAPLPGIGTEELEQAHKKIHKVLSDKNNSIITTSWLNNMNAYPASRFALESAFLSLLSQHKKQNLAQLLNSDYRKTVHLNTVCGNIATVSDSTIKTAEKKGFKCLKFKLGLQEPKQDAYRLKYVLEQLKANTKIRLDCNKSWTFEQSQWFIHYISNELNQYQHQLDSLEEPLKHYNFEQYRQLQEQLQEQGGISLALDESLSRVTDLKLLPVKRIVLKPTLCGGIINAWTLAQKAINLNLEVVVTSSIESAYGLWPISYLAAAIDNQQFHGLATADWLEDTLIAAPDIQYGTLTL